MAEPVALTPADVPILSAAPVDAPAPTAAPEPVAAPTVTLTQADLSRLLQDAVRAGMAQAQAGGFQPAQPIPVEVPPELTDREFYTLLLARLAHGFYTERERLAAEAYVNRVYPEPVEEK